MKQIFYSALILAMAWVLPSYADYGDMKKELENYQYPEKFITGEQLEPLGQKKLAQDPIPFDAVISEIERLKQIHGKTLSDEKTRLVKAGLDEKTFQRLFALHSDPAAVKKHISRGIRLEEIKILAALRNPGIQAAQKRVLAELQSFDQVMGLDDSLRQYTAFTKGLNNKAGPAKTKGLIKNAYPFPGLTALKGRIVQAQVALVSEKMDIETKQVLTRVANAYWERVFIENSIAVTHGTLDAFNRLKDVATTLYKSGKTSFQDVIKINIKMEELKEDLITLASQKKNTDIQILELLNLSPSTPMGRSITAPMPPKVPGPTVLFPFARKHRQELGVIRSKIRKLESMVEMAETMKEAPLTLGFSSFENDMVSSVGTDAQTPAFPVKTMAAMKNNRPDKPWYGTDEPWLNQTRQTLAALRQTLVNRENATDRLVRNGWFNLDKNLREYNLYKNKILPLSKSALDVSAREYEAGSIPFSQAIDSYTSWLNVKLTIAKKRSELGKAFAELENILGKKI